MARGALPDEERETTNYCKHIEKAREAHTTNNFAKSVELSIEIVLSKVSDEALEEAYRMEASDNEISIFVLPGGNVAVPLLGTEKNQYITDFVHVRDRKCTLDKCVKNVKSKFHTLVIKGVPVCRHSLLGKST